MFAVNIPQHATFCLKYKLNCLFWKNCRKSKKEIYTDFCWIVLLTKHTGSNVNRTFQVTKTINRFKKESWTDFCQIKPI